MGERLALSAGTRATGNTEVYHAAVPCQPHRPRRRRRSSSTMPAGSARRLGERHVHGTRAWDTAPLLGTTRAGHLNPPIDASARRQRERGLARAAQFEAGCAAHGRRGVRASPLRAARWRCVHSSRCRFSQRPVGRAEMNQTDDRRQPRATMARAGSERQAIGSKGQSSLV